MSLEQRAARFAHRSLRSGAKRVLVLGDVSPLLPYLAELMPDALLCVVSRQQVAKGFTVIADCRQLPFRRWSFDLALVFDLLPAVEDPVGFLNGVLRALRPGGTLTIGHRHEDPAGMPPSRVYRLLSDFGARTEAAASDGGEVFLLAIAP